MLHPLTEKETLMRLNSTIEMRILQINTKAIAEKFYLSAIIPKNTPLC